MLFGSGVKRAGSEKNCPKLEGSRGDVAYYDKQVAKELYEELLERLKLIPDSIDKATDDGPAIDIIAEALGAAISALKNGPQKED